MDIKSLHDRYKSGQTSVEAYIEEVFERIEKNNYNTYISLNKEKALEKARELDRQLKAGKEISGLFGVPVALKDNILTKGLRTTAACHFLDSYVPIYDAHVVKKIAETDAILIGKTNMDELAMGSSSETSYYGNVVNPFDPTAIPGGSSSGSAAAVAADEAVVALGTDTGGSCRNPANYCNVVGFAPSYGAISRFGVISMANSLDRVGMLANNVADIESIFRAIKGVDENDFTSLELEDYPEDIDLKGMKIAVVEMKNEFNLEGQVKRNYEKVLNILKDKGAIINTVDIHLLEYFNQVYTVLMSVEVAANIARIDGLRYGESVEKYKDVEDFYRQNRSRYFGEEAQRRIALGDFFASKVHNQKYYFQAMKLREMYKEEMDKILSENDIFLSPTATDLPYKVGAKYDDGNAAFDSGMFNTITNITNLPSISIPVEKDLLGSIQLIGARNQDMKLLKIAQKFEEVIGA